MREYLQRKRLAALGLTSDIGKFPAWKVDAFYLIDCELDRLAEDKRKNSN